jgi:UDP-N-acetylmuramate dehydrogenase
MEILEHVPLAEKTTIRIGGAARWYAEPSGAQEIAEGVAWAAERSLPVFVLGRGSNVVISDQGLPGLVLNVAARLTRITWSGNRAVCQAGALLHTLVREAVDRGLAGLECLAGIPGTMGGAVVMNAGAFGQEVGKCIEEVVWFDNTHHSLHRSKAGEMRFGYRHSLFTDQPGVVIEASLCFPPGDKTELGRMVRSVLARRSAKQPLSEPNCGSVFRNPEGQGAGRHIEAAGLKGASVGGIEVSQKHANFFVNKGGGTAEDFRRLMCRVQRTVHESCGVKLVPEVVFEGAFAQPLYTFVNGSAGKPGGDNS